MAKQVQRKTNVNVFRDLDGSVLETPEAIAEFYRSMFEDDLKLSDEEIVRIVNTIPGDDETVLKTYKDDETGEEMTDTVREARIDLLSRSDPAQSPGAAGDTGRVLPDLTQTEPPQDQHAESGVHAAARAVAEKLANDKEYNQVIVDLGKSKEVQNYGPLAIYLRWVADIGEEGIAEMPVPDSKQGETGNALSDKYKRRVWDGTEWKDRAASFYGDLFDQTLVGQEYQTALIEREKARQQTPPQDADPTLVAKTPLVLGREIANIQMKRRYAINNLRRVKKFADTKRAIENIPNCQVEVGLLWECDENGHPVEGKLLRTPNPIVLRDKRNPNGMPEFFSVNSFIRLKPQEAKAPTIAAIKMTGARGPGKKTPGTTTTKDTGKVTAKEAVLGIARLASSFQSEEFEAAYVQRLNSAEGDAYVLDGHALFIALSEQFGESGPFHRRAMELIEDKRTAQAKAGMEKGKKAA